MKKTLRFALLLLVMLGLASGILRAALVPKAINNYENRPARQLPVWAEERYASGAFQEDVEAALSDQVPFSQYFKKAYNELSSLYLKTVLQPILRAHPDLVLHYNGMRIYRGYMLYSRYDLEGCKSDYDVLIESYNAAMAANPDTRFSFFYIETDKTLDPVTGRKNDSFAYLRAGLHTEEGQLRRLELNSFEDYSAWFRKTDHHWNHRGSYAAYREILDMFGLADEALQPEEERVVSARYTGTKAASARLPRFTEEAAVYFFSYPDLGADFGAEAQYRDGSAPEPFSYGRFYGGDFGEFVFDTGRSDRENLLVIGDSFDNAILKLLASHFGKTYSVDLRYYTSESGEKALDLTDYIATHGIDRVLVIGSDFLYLDAEFAVRS